MPEYSQTLRVTFKTPEEARKAELKKLELPGGKKLAFSTRWDDTNNRHLKMAQTLAAQGYKGTFYLYDFLNEQSDRTVPAEILKLGSSLGSHTVDHQDLPGLLPAGIFYQILEQRIREEAAYDTCVTAFVLFDPFPGPCAPSDRRYPETQRPLRRPGTVGRRRRPLRLGAKRVVRQFHVRNQRPQSLPGAV